MLKIGTILKVSKASRTQTVMNEDYGYRIRDSKGDAHPCELMLDFFAADRIWVRPQQSCAYGPQVSLLCLLSFKSVRFCPCLCNLRFMPRFSSFGYLGFNWIPKVWNLSTILPFWDCYATNVPSSKLREGFNLSLVNWFQFLTSACWMLVNLRRLGLSIDELVVTILFGNFVQNDWGLKIFMNYASEFWVEAYTLSPCCEDLVGFYLALTVSSWLRELLSRVQLRNVSCHLAIINFLVYPLPLYFLCTCWPVGMIDLLGILLTASFKEDVLLEVVIHLLLWVLHSWFYLILFLGLCCQTYESHSCSDKRVAWLVHKVIKLFGTIVALCW